MAKYVFITGAVVSSVGITKSSGEFYRLLKESALHIQPPLYVMLSAHDISRLAEQHEKV